MLFDRLSFDFLRDIRAVSSVFETPLVVEVNPSVPVRTIPEFIAYAKANPDSQLCQAGRRNPSSCGRRAIQNDHRSELRARALSQKVGSVKS
jgi:tripartite-type tricarboxylate transporter receptor subunit TctC